MTRIENIAGKLVDRNQHFAIYKLRDNYIVWRCLVYGEFAIFLTCYSTLTAARKAAGIDTSPKEKVA